MPGALAADPRSAIEIRTVRQISRRLLPLLIAAYFFAFISRTNVGLAALQMNQDLGISPSTFGLGSSLFFVSYTLFGIPCNLAMVRIGARWWLSLMIVALSLTSLGMVLVRGPISFGVIRFLLGAAEAGFFPGAVLYLTLWFPRAYRARIIAAFMLAVPLASVLGSLPSAALLALEGRGGLHGWQWMFLLESLPIVVLGVVAFYVLPNRPAEMRSLSPEAVQWLTHRLAEERANPTGSSRGSFWQILLDPRVVLLSLAYAATSAASNALSLWQPQIIRSFGLTNDQVGLLNALPFALGLCAMIAWGRWSDHTGERRLSTALPLLLCAAALALTLTTTSLAVTVTLLCVALIGTYAGKGPFWALAADWLSPTAAPAGIAAINTLAHVATFCAIYLVGVIKSSTGSFPVALLPLVGLGLAGAIGLITKGKAAAPARADAPASLP